MKVRERKRREKNRKKMKGSGSLFLLQIFLNSLKFKYIIIFIQCVNCGRESDGREKEREK